MCIIAALPEINNIKEDVDYKHLEYAWDSNPHGSGYSYVENIGSDNAKVVVRKGWFQFKQFIKAFHNDRYDNPDSKFLIHFRYATRGGINKKNCHPFFVIENKISMVHNGTITGIGDSTQSDSLVFSKIMKSLYEDNIPLNSTAVSFLISKYIDKSKVVLLTDKNEFIFYNKNKGIQEKEIWFSNDYYKKKRYNINVYTGTYCNHWDHNVDNIYDYCLTDGCMNYLYDNIEQQTGYCIKCINMNKSASIYCLCGKRLRKEKEFKENMCFQCMSEKTSRRQR